MKTKVWLIPVVLIVLVGAGFILRGFNAPVGTDSPAPLSSLRPDSNDPLAARAIEAGRPMVVDFGMGWCVECKKMEAILVELAEEMGEKVTIVKVNVQQDQELTSRYGITLIPTVMIYGADGRRRFTHVGVVSLEDLRKQLAGLLVG